MKFHKIPFIKLTLLLTVIAIIIYFYGAVKIDIIHNPEAIKEIIPYINTAMILGCIAITTIVLAILQRFRNSEQSIVNENVL